MTTHTVLLRLAGPMQAWGTQSRFNTRHTELEPSKSGVIGLVCAALGRPRTESVDDLGALTFGVRVNREGSLASDYQTAGAAHHPGDPSQGIYTADGKRGNNAVTTRYYLADADFTVGLAGPDLAVLARIDAALRQPRWPLCLGRKAFPPGLPVALPRSGVRQGLPLAQALRAEPLPTDRRTGRKPRAVRLIVEESDLAMTTGLRDDQPIGAAFATRTFTTRGVREETIAAGAATAADPSNDEES